MEIQSATVDVALKDLSRQTGYSVIFQSDEVKSAQSRAVVGHYTVEAALDILLEMTEHAEFTVTVIDGYKVPEKREWVIQGNFFRLHRFSLFIIGIVREIANHFGDFAAARGIDRCSPAVPFL